MPYAEIIPTSRADLQEKVSKIYGKMMESKFALVASPPGSGKTRIMHDIVAHIIPRLRPTSIAYMLPPNDELKDQIITAFRDITKGAPLEIIDINSSGEGAMGLIKRVLMAGKTPIVFKSHPGNSGGRYTKDTATLLKIMEFFRKKGVYQAVLIDELDKQLTHLTGSLSVSFYHSRGPRNHYKEVRGNDVNLFDQFRKYVDHVGAFSGTLNNTICSKLICCGYVPDDVFLLNAAPIPGLYSKLVCESLDTEDIHVLAPYLHESEASPDHNLMIFPTKKKVEKFIKDYTDFFGKPPSYTRVDSDSPSPEKGALNKYILGVNMLSVGFDFATWMPNCELRLGILVRALSDKGSNPLSSNPGHLLHHEQSPTLLQVLLRMRDGGKFLTPPKVGCVNISDAMERTFQIIKEGWNEFVRFGKIPATNQKDRWCRAFLVALFQNIRYIGEDREKVAECLDGLKEITGGLCGESAYRSDAPLDLPMWTAAAGVLWDCWILDDEKDFIVDLPAAKKALIDTFRATYLSGGGTRSVRLEDEEIKAIVMERARNRCMHCGEIIRLEKQRQISHMHRHDSGGAYAVDNLALTHVSCDAAVDSCELIYARDGTAVFSQPEGSKIPNPDVIQLKEMSAGNLSRRYDWVKRYLDKDHLSDGGFEEYLLSEGYLRTPVGSMR